MVKAKKARARKSNVAKSAIGKVPRGRMSNEVTEYAKLLLNPCTGPLVHAPGSTEGGQVMRFESDQIIGNGATDTAGILTWAPGALNTVVGTINGGLMFGSSTGDTVAPTLTNQALFPGSAYLQANASSYRCIAACVQVYWPGSELNRQGIVAAAQGTYGLLSTASTQTPATVRAICPVVERMPTNNMEVKWAPNYSDGLFRNPSGLNYPEDGHASILLSWAGLPVATGIRVRCVAVYEWRPKVSGLVLSSNTSNGNSAAVQEVRRMLDRKDANWWNKTGQAAYNFLSGVTVAYAARRASGYQRIEL